MFWTQIFDLALGIGTLVIQGGTLGLVGLYFFGKHTRIYQWIVENNIFLAFILSLVAVIGSLFYSQIIGLEPCLFCWWQRICIFPLALILGIASWKKEGILIKKYALALATIGSLFAIYHYLIEKFSSIAETVDCTVGGSISCSISPVSVIGGYVTIPMMSLTILVIIIMLLSIKKT